MNRGVACAAPFPRRILLMLHLKAPLLIVYGIMVRRRARHHNSGVTARSGKPAALSARLLAWYDRSRRDLPWRAKAYKQPDPYRVWLSEIMLQQTTVATVGPYFRRFVALWPDIHALAAADLDDVLREWQGLGYYARARNLHRCAREVSGTLGGRFPESEAGLRELPGIGPYTAAAIAAIAFSKPASAVDGNVERVIARLFGVTQPLPRSKPELRALATTLVPGRRAGDYAQAVMDLGATVCTPRKPACPACPWSGTCAAKAAGTAETLPRRSRKKPRPTRHAVAFFMTRSDGAIWLQRRPERGLLGGMMEVPSTPWRQQSWVEAEALLHAPKNVEWRVLPGVVSHGFTHFRFEVTVMAGVAKRAKSVPAGSDAGRWVLPGELGSAALPTVMKKIIRHAANQLAIGKEKATPLNATGAQQKARPRKAQAGGASSWGELLSRPSGGTEPA